MDIDFSIGNLRKVWFDTESNWATVHYFSDGFLKLEGFLPETLRDINIMYRPLGVMFFHSPSEHSFDGLHYDVECQIFFEDDNFNMAVVSVFFDQAQGGEFRNDFLDTLSLENAGKENFVNSIGNELQKIFDSFEYVEVYSYDGSLTFPPCRENVKWFLINEPLTIGARQLDLLKESFTENNRKVQNKITNDFVFTLSNVGTTDLTCPCSSPRM